MICEKTYLESINAFDSKILLYNYILYQGETNYFAIFPIDVATTHFLLENL